MALSKSSLRLSEKWFQRGLWLVALVFASFLIGLGSTIVGDLPKVESVQSLDDFVGQDKLEALEAQSKRAVQAEAAAADARQQAELRLKAASSDVAAARETFANWIATRRATQQSDQDPEVIARTRQLDELKAKENAVRAEVERAEKVQLDARQAAARALAAPQALREAGIKAYEENRRASELRVFAYRLALTLPLLLIAGWLFKTKRQSRWWPFVWGFILFALFAFFVELVPYLPSYGGYVRYLVGIVITVLVGRWVIVALQGYLERQRLAEQQPAQVRREELGYDVALGRLAKGVCPGCERPVDLKNPAIDFCPHCGIGLFDHCGRCNARKSAFAKFCHACGADAKTAAPGATATAATPAAMGAGAAQPASAGSAGSSLRG